MLTPELSNPITLKLIFERGRLASTGVLTFTIACRGSIIS